MADTDTEVATDPVDMLPHVQTAIRFLQALFDEQDCVLFRPIETWTEGGKKKSEVFYKHICYRRARPEGLRIIVPQLLALSAKVKANIFFGVSPRRGAFGEYDLAWQIRTVRVLWTDIDHVTVEDARERITKAGLPQPSILVNSGNGVHVYWLLETPYLIDDAGDPPAVKTEWETTRDGRNKPRKYIKQQGKKVYLDQRPHVARLSPKAEHIQDVLAGVAQAVGGDHTTDLVRLLRLPGSLNRKDERNGREPVPTVLVECDPSRRYPLSVFEAFKTASPETARTKKIREMPLPVPRKPTAAKIDKLHELIAASAIAEPGRRSEADFAVCCYAIKQGIAQEEVWAQVEQVGKFAEQGRRYFDVTWGKAALDTQEQLYSKLQGETQPRRQRSKRPVRQAVDPIVSPAGPEPASVPGGGPAGDLMHHDGPGPDRDEDDGSPWDLDDQELEEPERPTIRVDPTSTPVATTLHQVTDYLMSTKTCFLRAEQLVVIRGETIEPVLSSSELAGLLNPHVEFYFVKGEAGRYEPFPASYATTWLNQYAEKSRLPVITLFSRNPVYTSDWRLVPPGYDTASGIYYAGPGITAREGTEHLDTLLRDFCFRSPADRTNYLGMLLTALLVPQFIGAKPAVLFNGNQPGLGKTMLAQILAILRDGHPTETASYNANDEEFEKRLGTLVRRGTTTIIIDNAKGQGHRPRIDSACLERSITDRMLSFRLLGKSQEIRAENSHIFCLTANAPDVSPDLVSRSVVINLHYEGDPRHREFTLLDPESYAEQHRGELWGELIGLVERWKAAGMPQAQVHTRFNKRSCGNIIGGILEVNGQPDFLANAVEAAAQLDDTRREFTELVGLLADHPQGAWTAAELVALCQREGLLHTELKEGSPRSLATKLGTLAGRFVGERFGRPDGLTVTFLRTQDRKGNLYRVAVSEISEKMPNLTPYAEPLPNLETGQVRHT